MKRNNIHNSTLTQTQLEALIERYCDALTDEADEALLRQALVSGRYEQTPAVREALAVMSLCAVERSLTASNADDRMRRMPGRAVWAAAAAVVGIILVAGLWVYRPAGARSIDTQTETCHAYIAGRYITDQKVVMNQVANELACMAEASEQFDSGIEDQLDEFSDLIN